MTAKVGSGLMAISGLPRIASVVGPLRPRRGGLALGVTPDTVHSGTVPAAFLVAFGAGCFLGDFLAGDLAPPAGAPPKPAPRAILVPNIMRPPLDDPGYF